MPKPWEIMNAPEFVRLTVEQVAREIGLSPVPDVLTDWSLLEPNAYTSVRKEGDKTIYGIFLPPDPVASFGSLANFQGVVAHELGHVAHKDYERTRTFHHRMEYAADNFAAEHGYGDKLIASFEKRDATSDEPASDTHPSHKERIARIRRAMEAK